MSGNWYSFLTKDIIIITISKTIKVAAVAFTLLILYLWTAIVNSFLNRSETDIINKFLIDCNNLTKKLIKLFFSPNFPFPHPEKISENLTVAAGSGFISKDLYYKNRIFAGCYYYQWKVRRLVEWHNYILFLHHIEIPFPTLVLD